MDTCRCLKRVYSSLAHSSFQKRSANLFFFLLCGANWFVYCYMPAEPQGSRRVVNHTHHGQFFSLFFMDVGGYLKCKGRRYYSAAANARSGFACSPQMLLYVALMRDWYIVCFAQGKELSKWMKDGWTGQESHWGWQAGDLRLELRQIQLKSVSQSGQGGNPLSCEMSHWTCRYWFMFHYNFTDSSKNMANCTIFDPKLVREEISVNKSLFRSFFSHI